MSIGWKTVVFCNVRYIVQTHFRQEVNKDILDVTIAKMTIQSRLCSRLLVPGVHISGRHRTKCLKYCLVCSTSHSSAPTTFSFDKTTFKTRSQSKDFQKSSCSSTSSSPIPASLITSICLQAKTPFTTKPNAATLLALATFFSYSSCAPLPSTEDVALAGTTDTASDSVAEVDTPFVKRAKILTGSNSGPIPRRQTFDEYEPQKRCLNDGGEQNVDKHAKMLSGSNGGPIPRWKTYDETEPGEP